MRTTFRSARFLPLYLFAGILLPSQGLEANTESVELPTRKEIIFGLPSSDFRLPASLVDEILSSTNQYRKSNSKPALQMRDDLNTIARKHSQDMAKGRTGFGHDGFDDRHEKVKKIFHACTMSENVAYGRLDGKAVVGMWKGSAGHRKNLLGDYKYVGIGVASDNNGVTYFTQIFVK